MAHSTEHAAAAKRAPGHGGRSQNVPKRRVQGQSHADQARQHQRQQAVAQHTAAAPERQAARSICMLVMRLAHSISWRPAVAHGSVKLRVGHEVEDDMQADRPDRCQPVNVSEVHFA